MKLNRLPILLVAMLGLIAARWWASSANPEATVVAAVVRPNPGPSRSPSGVPDPAIAPVSRSPASPAATTVRADEPSIDDDGVGNPFAARHPPAPVAPPPQLAPPVAAAAPAAPESEPPYQVIGTYDDSKAPGVFVATPTGVEIARLGSSLGTDFKVTALTPQSLTLQQLVSKREFVLKIPGGAAQ